MNGKIVGSFVVIVSLAFGAFVYWSQEYRYYSEISAEAADMTLVSIATGEVEPLIVDGFEGIDGSSSPIRFRACFALPQQIATLTETYVPYDGATPLIAPSWFECFDAEAIGGALETGEALAFLSAKNIHDGVDRVVAVFPDGRAYAWHQLNEKYQD